MKRVAVFAFYDGKGKVRRYVLSYLKELKKHADKIVFVADNALEKEEAEKLNGSVDFVVAARHGEYDFGSYKRGVALAKREGLLASADELILCNDSCFCVGGFSSVFERMARTESDFFGLVETDVFQRHLQSYFLVFKKQCFEHLQEFLETVAHKNSLREVVLSYETVLTAFLESRGLKSAACVVAQKNVNPTKRPLEMMREYGFPLIKKKCFVEPSACDESVGKVFDALSESCRKDVCDAFDCADKGRLLNGLRFRRFKEFLFKKKVTSKGKLLIKVFKIPVYGKKIKTDACAG